MGEDKPNPIGFGFVVFNKLILEKKKMNEEKK